MASSLFGNNQTNQNLNPQNPLQMIMQAKQILNGQDPKTAALNLARQKGMTDQQINDLLKQISQNFKL